MNSRNSTLWPLVISSVCILLLASAHAAEGDRAAAPVGDPYRVQPGDTLEIVVDVGMDDFSPPPRVVVGPDGRFAYPIAGEVEAAGRTRPEIGAVLREGLEALYRRVQVTVNVASYGTREVLVHGEVVQPGVVEVAQDEITLGHAIAQVGGYTDNAGAVALYRADAAEGGTDLGAAGAEDTETALYPGDVVIVSKRPGLTVVGEVGNPGSLTLPIDARLTEVLAAVGSITPEGDPQHAILVNHENRTIVVDLDEVIKTPQSDINLPIADYHTLVVPPRQALAVIGEVARPGPQQVGQNTRLTDLLAMVGGLMDDAAPMATAVDEDGETVSLDLLGALSSPGSAADVSVQGLRTIVVPRARHEIIVTGAVESPGLLAPDALPTTLAEALLLAGGPEDNADLTQVVVSRPDGTQEVADASPLFGRDGAQGDPGALRSIMLDNRAIVRVPERRNRVTVFGAVRRPGPYEFTEGDTVIDAIGLAGGFAKDAVRRKVVLLRRDGDRVGYAEYNLRAGLRGGEDLLAGPLQDRDVVVVAPGKRGISIAGLAATLFSLGQVYRIVK